MQTTLRFFFLAALLAVSACSSEKVVPLKSPCVGLDGSPCGAKRPLNGNYNTTS